MTYGLDRHARATPVALDALACVALPTCALAMAEAERYLPRLTQLVDERLAANGLAGAPLVLRITGCPNGCARPYLGEVALVGKAPGRYNLFLGGDGKGHASQHAVPRECRRTDDRRGARCRVRRYAKERNDGERFGDFVRRAGLVGAQAA